MIEKTLQETLPESIHPQVTTLQEDIYEAQATENKLKGIILFFLSSACSLPCWEFIRPSHWIRNADKGSSYPEGKWSRIETDYFIVCPPLYKTADCFRSYCISIYLYSHTNVEKAYIVFFNDGIIYWAGISPE